MEIDWTLGSFGGEIRRFVVYAQGHRVPPYFGSIQVMDPSLVRWILANFPLWRANFRLSAALGAAWNRANPEFRDSGFDGFPGIARLS
jgi:hypothetical protein